MKKCKECGIEVPDDAMRCPNCGGHKGGYCSACGTKLTNDLERKQGMCVNCKSLSDKTSVAPPPKYIKRLRVFEIFCYICAAITFVTATLTGSPVLVAIGLIALVPWIGMGVVFGALREILIRIK